MHAFSLKKRIKQNRSKKRILVLLLFLANSFCALKHTVPWELKREHTKDNRVLIGEEKKRAEIKKLTESK